MFNFKMYLSVFFILIVTTLSAQIRFGAKAGIGYTNYRNIHIDSKARIGLNAGIVALQPFERYDYKNFIQYELNYVSHGEKNGNFNRHVNYIALPIMYKRYLSENDQTDIYLEIGPQFAYAIYNDFDKYEIEELGSKNNNYDYSDNHKLNKFDFSIGLGGGISINRKTEVGLRYNYGLIDSFKHRYKDNNINNSSLLSLSVTYLFGDY